MDLQPLHHGTWRERKGLHDFIAFALAPQRMGMLGSSFWTDTVMRLALTSTAVFHVASGIGALREHLHRPAEGEWPGREGSALAFGLRQCNRSIALLTQASRTGDSEYQDPGIALVVCILFTVFEALYADHHEALTHVLQGRKMLWRCEQFSPSHGGTTAVDLLTVRPVLGGLQLQAACLSGQRGTELVDQCPLDPLPVPDITCIHTLEQANRALHVIYSNLLLYHQNIRSYVAGADLSISAKQKQLRFTPWLRTWEKGFADFLFHKSSNLGHEDMQKAKVLKTNHLLSTILAQVDTTGGWRAWEPFEAEFKAIIDLSTAVLSAHRNGEIGDSDARMGLMPCISFGLWISEPLFVCVSRCTNEDFRRRAAGLLSGIPRGARREGLKKRTSAASAPTSSSRTISRASSSTNER